MSNPQVIDHYTLQRTPHRVLLFSPAVCDIRYPWREWQQPTSLLQLATVLGRAGCDLRLIDALFCPRRVALPKHRIRRLARGNTSVNYWRWGLEPSVLRRQLGDLGTEGWDPEEVFLLTGAACQWEGCSEAIGQIRQVFPQTRIVLYGDYPTYALSHAIARSGADQLVSGSIEEIQACPLDLSLYQVRPRIAHLSIGSVERPIADLLNELLHRATPPKRKERIGHIVLADADAFRRFPQHVRALCQTIAERNLSVSLHAFGGVHPGALVEDPALPALLKRAGLKQIIFTSDRDIPFTAESWATFLEMLHEAVARCCEAGYQLRTDNLVATLCLGRPQEDLTQVVARAVELAHVAGSIILLPYQPTPSECPELPLEETNGRLFPLAEANGYRYKEYLEVIGLAAVLNSKYRTRTFDFLGDGLVERLTRESLVTESWRPPASQGQSVTLGYFGKDGRWVKRLL